MASCSKKLDGGASHWSFLPCVIGAILLISDTALDAKTTSARPNILILLADDLGWKDVGYHGSEIKTPNIDRLAQEGVELDRFYVAPYCCPTRAGLMTGRYPHRFGYPYLSRLGRANRLPPEAQTVADMLGTAGYQRRACIGKWHLGGPDGGRHPLDQGFNHFYGFLGGMVDYFTHKTIPFVGRKPPMFDWHRNRELNHDEGYSTDLLADESVRFIENQSADEPFFLYAAFNAPHLPLQAKPEDLKLSADEVKLTGLLFTHDNKINRQICRAMVESLDDNIGRVLRAIDDKGFRENTLVLFLSDNGGQIERGASDNSPLRGSKNSLWEGGVRVPAAVRWPATLEGRRKISVPMGYIDVLPTLARIAGLSDASVKSTDGIDVLDVLTGKQRELDRRIYLGPGAIVSKRWKLVDGKLFQIDTDPGETTDVAADHPEVVKELQEETRRLEEDG
jgi:arylsulfatase B